MKSDSGGASNRETDNNLRNCTKKDETTSQTNVVTEKKNSEMKERAKRRRLHMICGNYARVFVCATLVSAFRTSSTAEEAAFESESDSESLWQSLPSSSSSSSLLSSKSCHCFWYLHNCLALKCLHVMRSLPLNVYLNAATVPHLAVVLWQALKGNQKHLLTVK